MRLREESLKVAGSWLKGGGQLESLEKKKGGERCDKKKSIKEKDSYERGDGDRRKIAKKRLCTIHKSRDKRTAFLTVLKVNQ